MKYCEKYAALLDLYVDGELSGTESVRVREHLECCPGCRAYVDDALAIRAAFADLEDVEVPEGFAAGVMEAVRTAEGAPGESRNAAGAGAARWKAVLLPLAACFALVLVLRYLPAGGGEAAVAPAVLDAPAEFSLASAAPAGEETEGGTHQEDAGTSPKTRVFTGYEDSCASVPEAQTDLGAPAPAEELISSPTAIRLTAVQADGLLESFVYTAGEGGVRCYQLTGGEFDSLLAALEERGTAPEWMESVPESEVFPEGCYLVYVQGN